MSTASVIRLSWRGEWTQGVTYDHEQTHTHISSAVHLATPSAVDALTKSTVTFSRVGLTSFYPLVKAVWAYTNTAWHAVSVDSVSEKVSIRVVKTLSVFTHDTRVSLTRLSLSPQSEYERGSPQTVIRLTEMGCWFGNPGELEAPRSTMTVFNQENVEDYYEIGDELGR